MADTVDLPRDGTAKITIGSERFVLAQPTLGQMRKLRELYDELLETVRAVRDHNNDVTMQNAANALDPKHKKKPIKKVDDDALVVGWVQEAFAILSDKELPPTDELPAWMVDGRFPKDLIEHWRTNPLHYGEK